METCYEIRDTAGVLRAVHVRHEGPGGKRMHWRRPDGTPGLGGTPTADLPLFGAELLPGLPPGATVIVTEGEKAAAALWPHGGRAVATVTGAAGTPGPAVLAPLVPHVPVLWPDYDAPGEGHMARVAAALRRLGGCPRRIAYGVHPGDDAADWAARGGTRVTLARLVADAAPWPDTPLPAENAPDFNPRAPGGYPGTRREEARGALYAVVTAHAGPPARTDGQGAWWHCPFHNERTPSFKVSTRPDEPYYRCHGCGARGDVFTFLRETEHLGYGAALRKLAPDAVPLRVW